MDLLDQIPKPLLYDIIYGRCVPIIGAGFSRNAELLNKEKMPLWDDLGRKVADQIPNYKYVNALEAISAFSHEFTKAKLIELVSDLIFIHQATVGNVHTSFCKLHFEKVITTNFDFLIEQGYTKIGKSYRPILDEDQLTIDIKNKHQDKSVTTLIKLHGDVHHPKRIIITEEDYDNFIIKYPLISTYLASILISNTILFIGYSLDDPDFRLIWQLIKNRLGELKRPAYVLMVAPPIHIVNRFERRGVKVISLTGEGSNISSILFNLFERMYSYWNEQVFKLGVSTVEETSTELALPNDAKSRLCFVSTPSDMIGFYKKHIYPIIEFHGYAPIMASDIVTPGDNYMAKVTALINRAQILVLDVETEASYTELNFALNTRSDKKKLLLISSKEKLIPPNDSVAYLSRPKKIGVKNERFVNEISKWFKRQSELEYEEFNKEPERLLEKGEFRAAIISSLSLFEVTLRKKILEKEPTEKEIIIPISLLLSKAKNLNILSQQEIDSIADLITIRNKIVHNATTIPREKANEKIKEINRFLVKLNKE